MLNHSLLTTPRVVKNLICVLTIFNLLRNYNLSQKVLTNGNYSNLFFISRKKIKKDDKPLADIAIDRKVASL